MSPKIQIQIQKFKNEVNFSITRSEEGKKRVSKNVYLVCQCIAKEIIEG
jgi:hypothetical protein